MDSLKYEEDSQLMMEKYEKYGWSKSPQTTENISSLVVLARKERRQQRVGQFTLRRGVGIRDVMFSFI